MNETLTTTASTATDSAFNNAVNNFDFNNPVQFAMFVVACLIIMVSLVSFVVSIVLAIKYAKYNKRENSAGLNGEEAARMILDKNGLEDIKVKVTGSLMFGNSYSHWFKKVRLRRKTIKKPSIASLAMAAQKSSLAVLDKEGDPDMKKRVKLSILNALGPIAFIPIIIIGIAIDIAIHQSVGTLSIGFACFGLVFYIISFISSLMVLKTEKKSQQKAAELLIKDHMATQEEVDEMQKLFKLYNIEYVNNLILSMLEILYYALRIISMLQGKGGSSNKK